MYGGPSGTPDFQKGSQNFHKKAGGPLATHVVTFSYFFGINLREIVIVRTMLVGTIMEAM